MLLHSCAMSLIEQCDIDHIMAHSCNLYVDEMEEDLYLYRLEHDLVAD